MFSQSSLFSFLCSLFSVSPSHRRLTKMHCVFEFFSQTGDCLTRVIYVLFASKCVAAVTFCRKMRNILFLPTASSIDDFVLLSC